MTTYNRQTIPHKSFIRTRLQN